MKKNLLLEALLSLDGKADVKSVYEYVKAREPNITQKEFEEMLKEALSSGDKIIRKGDELLIDD
ncbi:hypothetical protein [Ignicoccus hospitalis]|uniref:hypothetical protein n=1 Tax=Ignicoccus hospitalis TaxID=160233 RepID=UPI0011D150D3|nr:hypothetical protein [Ignicoccus hospitalis]HIH90228.1 hypothetical protein [Desulfurococcaceae archaeon]